jgi:hypothetical protein
MLALGLPEARSGQQFALLAADFYGGIPVGRAFRPWSIEVSLDE